MSPINDSDLLLVERAGSLYKVTYDRLSELNDTDLLLVERGGTLYKCQVSNNGSIADSDLLLVERSGTNYKLAGSGLTFNSSFITILEDTTFAINTLGFHVDGASNLYNLHFQRHGDAASVVTKLSEDGAFQWSTAIDFKSNTPRNLSSDDSGNVYVAGYAQENNTSNRFDLFIAKLNSSGALQWSSRLGTQTSGFPAYSDYAYTISTDGSGNSYMSGFEYLNRDIFLVKYNSAGTLQWQRRINGLDGQGMYTAIDSAGYIYVGANFNFGISISKWNSSGSLIWNKMIEDPGFAKSVVVDGSDNIYIGATNRSQNRVNLIKLNSSGTLQWQKQISSGDYDRNPNVTTTTSGNIIVEFASLTASDWDTRVIAFDASGNVQWRRSLQNYSNQPVMIGGRSNTKGFFISCEKLSDTRHAILKLPADGSKTGAYSGYFPETFTYSSITQGSVTNTSYSVTDITNSYSVVAMSLFSGPAGFSVVSNATSSVGVQNI